MPEPADSRDVLDRTAALLENADDPLEVELVLAGLAALTEPSALRPLVKRAASVQHGPERDARQHAGERGMANCAVDCAFSPRVQPGRLGGITYQRTPL